jgi:hypothetical protein
MWLADVPALVITERRKLFSSDVLSGVLIENELALRV